MGKSIGEAGDDRGNVIKTDTLGNIYVAGGFSGTVDFDQGSGVHNLSSVGKLDLYIAKYDASGNFLWAYSDGSTENDLFFDMAVDDTGSAYITGYASYGGSGSLKACVVVKLDSSGNGQWSQTYTSTQANVGGYALSIDASGNVYVGGNFNGTVDFDPGSSGGDLTTTGNVNHFDAFILKLNTSGNFQWAKQFRVHSDNANVKAITLDASGNIYSTGEFWKNSMDCDPDTGGTAYLSNLGLSDIFISKLDSNGNYVWAKGIGGGTVDSGNSIAVDASGNVYTTGYFGGTADFDPGTGTHNLTSAGIKDIFVSKLDASGNYVWAKSIGTISAAVGNSIALDASGNVYTTGYFEGYADFDPGVGTDSLESTGGKDIFVSKLDNNGDHVWAHSLGSFPDDNGQSILVDASDNIFIAGYYEDLVDFNPTNDIANLFAAGGRDAFFTKWSQDQDTVIGLQNSVLSENIKLYPNPTTSTLNFDSKGLEVNSIMISDVTGKVIKSISSVSNTIDVSSLVNGLYIIQIQTDKGIYNSKFIKQ